MVLALLSLLSSAAPVEQAPHAWFLGGEGRADYALKNLPNGGCAGGQAVELSSATQAPSGSATLMQIVKADQYRGKKLRFSGQLQGKTTRPAVLWIRVDAGAPPFPVLFHRSSGSITGAEECELVDVEIDVPPEASQISLGVLLEGRGAVQLDTPELKVIGEASAIDFTEADPRGRVNQVYFNDGVIATRRVSNASAYRMTHKPDGSWAALGGDDYALSTGDGEWKVKIGIHEGTFHVSREGALNVISGSWGNWFKKFPVRIEWDEQHIATQWDWRKYLRTRYDTPQTEAGCRRYANCGAERFDLCGEALGDNPPSPQTIVAFLLTGFPHGNECPAGWTPPP